MLQTQASNGTNQSENKHIAKTFSFCGTLKSLGTVDRIPEFRFQWNSNEEVFIILTSLEGHKNWVASEVKIRPPNGSLLLYNRNNLKTRSYHLDKYFWKTRKNSKSSARVDHSSLRIRGIECIYCSYVHSALVPTFHRRCYWLLENPDIVLVHYLNIPDRTTTFDDLVTSLLPYKTLTEQELLCQLQPILTSNEVEGNNNKIIPVNVKKLVAEIKNYKEPKTKGKANQRKTSGGNKQAVSSTQRKPAEKNGKASNSLDKCTNCKRYYTTKPSTTSTSSRTNVAVTINRHSASKISVSGASSCAQSTSTTGATGSNIPEHGSESTVVQNAVQNNVPGVSPNISRSTPSQNVLTTDLISGHSHANQIYPCHDLLQQSPYAIASRNPPTNTLSNGYHGYVNGPVTTQALLENDLLVLDYDGMNLVQSGHSENDLSKTFDIGLFDNDLLNYLPDILPDVNDLQPSLPKGGSPGIMPTSLSTMTVDACDLPKVTPHSRRSEQPLCNEVISSQTGVPSYLQNGNFVQQSSAINTGVPTRIGQTCSPTEMITTDCHSLHNLAPSLLHTSASIDDLLPDCHQCLSKYHTSRGHVNLLQIGLPEEDIVDTGVSQMNVSKVNVAQGGLFQENMTQNNLLQFGLAQSDVSKFQANLSHVGVSQQSVRRMEMSKAGRTTKGVSSLGFVPQCSVSQPGGSMVGISNVCESSEGGFNVETNGEGFPNVGLCHMDVSAARASSMASAQEDIFQLGISQGAFSVESTKAALSNVVVSPAVSSTITVTQSSCTSTQNNPSNLSENIITEFSPEWSYCNGKTKVLILGDWSRHNGSYSCLFDGCSVPANLIQPGVLRCYCPPHDFGLVSLQVAWNGFIISNACVFEYKTRENATNSVSDWLSPRDEDLKKLILERIERLEGILGIQMLSGSNEGEVGTTEREIDALEDRIVRICEVLLRQPEASVPPGTETGSKGLSLLHLAAGLGYTKLIRMLKTHACVVQSHTVGTGSKSVDNLTETHEFSKQSAEWSPRTKDSFGCTPLMWACWRGHHDAAMTLLAWQPSSYGDCDQSGRSAKTVAQEMGHVSLVREMEEFMCGEDMYYLVMESSPQSPSSSCAYLSVSSNEQVPQSPMSEDSLTWERVEGTAERSPDFEMASVVSEDRPNTLGKVLVEIRTLIQQAEETARYSLQTPRNSAPFALGFTGFSDLPSDEGTSDNLLSCEQEFGPRTPHYDTLSIDSSPIRTPSSHSPGSPAMRNSPQSTGTDTSEFEEFLSKPRQFLERDFSELTLTDIEQQELLQAAKIIQNAYRQFKIRKKQHVDELKAAVLIQSYYRRYKQFALYRKITKAAVLIQNSYRAHKEHEQFKRSRHAAAVIQTYFRHYRKRKQRNTEEDSPGRRLGTKYRKPSYGK